MHPVRFFLPLALILFVLVAADTGRGSYESKGINAVASWLAQREVFVTCLSAQESKEDLIIGGYGAEAYVQGYLDLNGGWHPWSNATFKVGYCETLDGLIHGKPVRGREKLAQAILILTHEAGHLRGHRWSADEAKTECWAIRHFKYVAARLGVEPGSWDMALLYAFAVEFHYGLPAQYHLSHPNGCTVPPTA